MKTGFEMFRALPLQNKYHSTYLHAKLSTVSKTAQNIEVVTSGQLNYVKRHVSTWYTNDTKLCLSRRQERVQSRAKKKTKNMLETTL